MPLDATQISCPYLKPRATPFPEKLHVFIAKAIVPLKYIPQPEAEFAAKLLLVHRLLVNVQFEKLVVLVPYI